MAGYCTSVRSYFYEPLRKYSTRVQYPAILPSHTSNNRFSIYYCDLATPRRLTATAHAQYKGRCCVHI